ncbi:MAG TPA: DUF4388 domain-containing protein [Thermoanaerobaculia bacterium]|nr:DUF4388 domain-containing protein [Thermoanaerobaculia bacterium]
MADAVLHGDISAFRLPDVLTFLSTSRKSGTLTVACDGREAWLYFQDGALVYAGSNREEFRLGSILLRKKKITSEQRARIDELMLREGGRFGELAVQEHVLSEEQLRDFLKVQVSEIVYDAFVWHGGTFAFTRETSLPSYAVTIAIDLPNLIMEGARRIEEWEQCLRLLPDQNVVFRVVSTPRDEKITLTVDEWKILFLINGQRTLGELCQDTDEPLSIYRVVYGLYANKLIEKVRGARTTEGGAEADATMRQGAPRFGAESTVRDEPAGGDDTSLLVSAEGRLSYADVVRPTLAQFRTTDGAGADRVIPLAEPEYLIGRHRDNTIQIADLGVSGFHARIYRGPEGYVIEDLKSRNGTWVNDARVFHHLLADGDRVHVGQTDLRYEVLFTA